MKDQIEIDIVSILLSQGHLLDTDNHELQNLDTEFKDDLGMDSLDKVDLIQGCETKFNITIPSEDVYSICTIGQLVDYVHDRIEDRRPG